MVRTATCVSNRLLGRATTIGQKPKCHKNGEYKARRQIMHGQWAGSMQTEKAIGKNKRGRHESPHEANERIMRKLISRHFLSQGQYNMVTGAVIFNGVSEEQQQVRFPSLVGPRLGLSVMSVAISN